MNKVTWYSKLLAMVLFVGLPFLGFYLGIKYGRMGAEPYSPSSSATTSVQSGYNSSGWQLWRDDANDFEFRYPNGLEAAKGEAAPTPNWRVDADQKLSPGNDVATVNVPSAIELNTNFADAKFHVGVSRNDAAIAGCLKSNFGDSNAATSTVAINGIQFTYFEGHDAGAGNRYDTKSYRTLHAGRCYALDLTTHYTVLENYPAEFGYSEFNRAKIDSLLGAMMSTFKFISADTSGGLVPRRKLVEDYLKSTISKISPQKAVLGGTFYVTKVELASSNAGTVSYEDGHIALRASFDYSIGPNQQVYINNFKVLPLSPSSKGKVCAQVITSAKNPATGEVRDFPTPCDVPQGWVVQPAMPY